jgi:hypothetical protein
MRATYPIAQSKKSEMGAKILSVPVEDLIRDQDILSDELGSSLRDRETVGNGQYPRSLRSQNRRTSGEN